MTDVAAAAVWLQEHYSGDFAQTADEMLEKGRTMFSPIVLSFLNVKDCRSALHEVLQDTESRYRAAYESLAPDRHSGKVND
jgi:hypothetical protein